MKKNQWLIWLSFLISAVFLYFAFRKVDFAGLWQVLIKTSYFWLIPGLIIYFGGVWVRTWRWQYLLKPFKKVPLSQLFPVICIGYMGNNIYPVRLGEVVRSVALKRRADVPVSGSLATIVVERLFDAVVILAFVVLNIGQLANLPGENAVIQIARDNALWVAGLFLLILLIFVAVAMFPAPAQKAITWLVNHIIPQKFRQPVQGIADKFLEGLKSLRSPLDALMILLTTALIWVLETGLYWAVMKALGFDLGFFQLMFLNGIVNLMLLVPAAPSGIGPFDFACIGMLEAYGIANNYAVSFNLILRIALFLPITALGLIYFIREGLKWTTDVNQLQAQAETPPQEGNTPT